MFVLAHTNVHHARTRAGRIVAITIADTAIAKTRPLGPEVYAALQQLGAAKECDIIGYRNPFAFIGVKGGEPGSAMYCLDKHAQSKTMLRAEASVSVVVAGAKKAKLAGKPKAAEGKGKGKGKAKEKAAAPAGGAARRVVLVGCRAGRTLVTEKIEAIDKGSTAPCTESTSTSGPAPKRARR